MIVGDNTGDNTGITVVNSITVAIFNDTSRYKVVDSPSLYVKMLIFLSILPLGGDDLTIRFNTV